jgi:hypothetical protein
MFYYSCVIDTNKRKLYYLAVRAAQKFTKALSLKEGSNMIVLLVYKSKSSKPEGSTFFINLDYIIATIRVVMQALKDKSLINKTEQLIIVTIIVIYKA